jgi:hypothetical protein
LKVISEQIPQGERLEISKRKGNTHRRRLVGLPFPPINPETDSEGFDEIVVLVGSRFEKLDGKLEAW